MKNNIKFTLKAIAFIYALAFVFFVSVAFPQRIDSIGTKCPNTNAFYSSILARSNGDLTFLPCPTRSSIFTGNVNFTAATVNFGLTNQRIPVANINGGLTNSPFSWTGTAYEFQNAAFNAFPNGYYLQLTPDSNLLTQGRFFVGTATGLAHYIESDVANGFIRFSVNDDVGIRLDDTTGGVLLGDYAGEASGYYLSVNARSERFEFLNAFAVNDGTVSYSGVNNFNYQRTIVPTGTTGNVTINRPAGRVNFAAAQANLTVTNSTVTADSIVLITIQAQDPTCTSGIVIPNAGDFAIRLNAACTAETPVGFLVIN